MYLINLIYFLTVQFSLIFLIYQVFKIFISDVYYISLKVISERSFLFCTFCTLVSRKDSKFHGCKLMIGYGSCESYRRRRRKIPRKSGSTCLPGSFLKCDASVSEFGVHLMIKFESEYMFSGFDSLSAITWFTFC